MGIRTQKDRNREKEGQNTGDEAERSLDRKTWKAPEAKRGRSRNSIKRDPKKEGKKKNSDRRKGLEMPGWLSR